MAQQLIALRAMIDELEKAVSGNSAWVYLRDFASLAGYSHLLALRVATSTDHFVALRVLNADGAGAACGDETFATLGNRHPISRQTRLSREPFLISEISDFPDSAGPCLIDAFSAQFKHSSVLVVPLVGRLGGAEAYFAFGGRNPDAAPMTRLLLQVASYAALSQSSGQSGVIPARRIRTTNGSLTAKEAGCLRMSSMGKTDAELSEAVGVTMRTVRRHLANAKRKLGVPARRSNAGRRDVIGREI